VPAELLEHFRGTGELEAAEGSPADADIVDAPAASRFELRLDGRLIGIAAYRRRNGSIVFTHTVIDESCQGRGFASALTEAALQSAAREGAEVVPLCSFTAAYIDRHPEFEPLVASSYRDRS